MSSSVMPTRSTSNTGRHTAQLRAMFPDESRGIDEYVRISDASMDAVKLFVVAKFLPASWRAAWWRLIPSRIIAPQLQTGEALLGKLFRSRMLRSLLCGLWIDTGARPDTASFLLTGAVQRGLPKEGGCYPRGGAESLAATLIPVIEKWGGRVLIDAPVGEVVCDAAGRTTGVRMRDGTEIDAPIVVSSCGYANTFGHLVPEAVTDRFNIPRQLPVGDSKGFVMANIGIRARPEEVGVTNTNLWYHPADAEGDIFPAMRDFFADPLGKEPPAMITFPSLKDQEWHLKHPDRICCQMLVMADWEWFKEWAAEPHQRRGADYDALKKRWSKSASRCCSASSRRPRGRSSCATCRPPSASMSGSARLAAALSDSISRRSVSSTRKCSDGSTR